MSLESSFIMFQSLEDILIKTLENGLIIRLLIILVAFIVAALTLREYHKRLEKMAAAKTIESVAVEKLYRIVAFITIIILLVIVSYALTKSEASWITIAAIVVVLIVASWDYIVNSIAYFFLLSTHYVNQGDYIVVSNSIKGRVREITSFYTVIEESGKVLHVPNKDLITKGFSLIGEPSYVRITVKVSGLSSPEDVDEIKHGIENALSMKTSDLFSFHHGTHVSPMIKVYPRIIENDSVTFTVEVPIPSPSPHLVARRISSLIYPIASVLRDSGYSFTVEIEGV